MIDDGQERRVLSDRRMVDDILDEIIVQVLHLVEVAEEWGTLLPHKPELLLGRPLLEDGLAVVRQNARSFDSRAVGQAVEGLVHLLGNQLQFFLRPSAVLHHVVHVELDDVCQEISEIL